MALISGTAGDDYLRGIFASDTLDGGDGTDTADYRYLDLSPGISISASLLTGVVSFPGHTETAQLISIENVIGGPESDTLVGDEGNNLLGGQAGDDILSGGFGADQLLGDDGNDQLFGNEGNDFLAGGLGVDLLDGGDGDDQLFGNEGNDLLYGGFGFDKFDGGDGRDSVLFSSTVLSALFPDIYPGGGGLSYSRPVFASLLTGIVSFSGESGTGQLVSIENLWGSEASDTLIGNDEDNQLVGAGGDDTLFGGLGNDTLIGGGGDDHLFGNEGDDVLLGTLGFDTLDGGDGIDLANYQKISLLTPGVPAGYAVSASLLTGIVSFAGESRTGRLISIENLAGSDGNDTLIGNDDDNTLYGGNGNDQLFGSAGNDTLYGSDGADTLDGGVGSDTLDGGDGNDSVDYRYLDATSGVSIYASLLTGIVSFAGETETDQLISIENIIGGAGSDTLVGDTGVNVLRGGAGNDILRGEAGDDVLDGGDGTDTAIYAGARAGFIVAKQGSTFTITDKTGVEGTDTLTTMEKLQFSDKLFDLVNPPRTSAPDYGKDGGFLFDPVFYLLNNPELVPTVGLETALQSFRAVGAAQHEAPNSWFNATYYANKWADLKPLQLDDGTLFAHYNLYGVWEGRSGGPKFELFDGNRYLAENPDVAAYVDANVDDFLGSRSNGAIAHFIIYGNNEQRLAYDLVGQPIDMGYIV